MQIHRDAMAPKRHCIPVYLQPRQLAEVGAELRLAARPAGKGVFNDTGDHVIRLRSSLSLTFSGLTDHPGPSSWHHMPYADCATAP